MTTKNNDAVDFVRLAVGGVFAPLLVVAGVVLAWYSFPVEGGILAVAGGIAGYYSYRRYRGLTRADTLEDERAQRVTEKAGLNALWIVILVMIAGVYFYPRLVVGGPLESFASSYGGLGGIYLAVGFLAYAGGRLYYSHRGP
ncbi:MULTISPECIES: DUF2178 domain-containing protein [Haloferax]|uniref:DUF2178 domain protein n=2 Tax=Haloferax TaxID=2251 RepID=A0A871BJD7_HALGI|nr:MULTISPECIES: DUF2178 domain-containing protein [Haloferax]ELZ65126.1 hypothetical protein C457_16532 [Haloferax prahovense DSM 18310]QOS12906.1 DUF2178 domain protein [Haloferax gibbonsii]